MSPFSTPRTSRRVAGAWWQRRAKAQAIGVSRSGRTTEIHAVSDFLGHPVALTLTPGNTPDIKAAELLKEQSHPLPPPHRRPRLRRQQRPQDLGRGWNRPRSSQVASTASSAFSTTHAAIRDCWLIEAMFCRLKDFHRVATRYDEPAPYFLSTAALTAGGAF